MATVRQLIDQPRAPASILFNVVGHLTNRPRRVQIAALEVDATISEVHEAEAEATEHPVESGGVVSDHVILKPRRYRMEGMVSNAPVEFSAVALAKRAAEVGRAAVGLAAKPMADRAFTLLTNLLDAREMVTVVTPLVKYSDLVLIALSFPRDAQTGDALRFSATFKQIRRVDSVETELERIPEDSPAAPKKDLGTQSPRATADAVKAKATELLRLLNASGAAIGR